MVRLVQSSGAEKPYRQHYIPYLGAGSGIPVNSSLYWVRARTRERLASKLRSALNGRLDRERDKRPERIALDHTMAGWQ